MMALLIIAIILREGREAARSHQLPSSRVRVQRALRRPSLVMRRHITCPLAQISEDDWRDVLPRTPNSTPLRGRKEGRKEGEGRQTGTRAAMDNIARVIIVSPANAAFSACQCGLELKRHRQRGNNLQQ